ncbi:MAG: DUF3667 domain-containing protein [Cyclobacteriaceae bacterium]
MKTQRKGEKCLNCGELLLPEDNYCRVCGQLNDDPNVSFGTLLFDFLSNYFSLDSRFSRSVVPFLFRPGYLTNRFIEGKRVSFANPIRLYLIISVIYFFLLSLAVTDLTDTFSNADMEDSAGNRLEGAQVLDSLESAFNMEIETSAEQSNNMINIDLGDSLNDSALEQVWLKYREMKKSGQYSSADMIDQLVSEQQPWWQQLLIRQYIRIDNSEVSSVTSYLIKNASIMMFFLLPIFALVLKLVYVRRKHLLYFHHLIHGIHLHSFAFVLFSLSILMSLVWSVDVDVYRVILLMVYLYFSFKRVYQQGYLKTAAKLITLFLLYGGIFCFALVIEVMISLLIF